MSRLLTAYNRKSVSPENPSAPLSAEAETASTHPYTIAIRNTSVLQERLAIASLQNRGSSTASVARNRRFERAALISM